MRVKHRCSHGAYLAEGVAAEVSSNTMSCRLLHVELVCHSRDTVHALILLPNHVPITSTLVIITQPWPFVGLAEQEVSTAAVTCAELLLFFGLSVSPRFTASYFGGIRVWIYFFSY